mgnify:CR=1 FL=1
MDRRGAIGVSGVSGLPQRSRGRDDGRPLVRRLQHPGSGGLPLFRPGIRRGRSDRGCLGRHRLSRRRPSATATAARLVLPAERAADPSMSARARRPACVRSASGSCAGRCPASRRNAALRTLHDQAPGPQAVALRPAARKGALGGDLLSGQTQASRRGRPRRPPALGPSQATSVVQASLEGGDELLRSRASAGPGCTDASPARAARPGRAATSLGRNLGVEGERLLDLRLRNIGAEEVVGRLDRRSRAARHPALDRTFCGPGEMLMVVLGQRKWYWDWRTVSRRLAPRRRIRARPGSRRSPSTDEPIRVGVDVDHLAEAGVRRPGSGSTRGSSRARPSSSPRLRPRGRASGSAGRRGRARSRAIVSGKSPSASDSGRRVGIGVDEDERPQVSTETGSSDSADASEAGLALGARAPGAGLPSRLVGPRVVGHCSVARQPLPRHDVAAMAADVDERPQLRRRPSRCDA